MNESWSQGMKEVRMKKLRHLESTSPCMDPASTFLNLAQTRAAIGPELVDVVGVALPALGSFFRPRRKAVERRQPGALSLG